MLKLPVSEIKELCLYHLLLKELVPCEVSLYALELEFLERKESAFLFYELNVAYEPGMFTQSQNYDKRNRRNRLYTKAFDLLHSLEDRCVNPIVAYRLYNSRTDKSQWLRHIVVTLLQSRSEESLSSEEAYYLALLSRHCKTAWRLYELAASKGSTKAMRYIAIHYERTHNMKQAIFYYEQAIARGCPCAMYELTTTLTFFDQRGPRYVELLKQAALLGHQDAIERCRREGITTLLSEL